MGHGVGTRWNRVRTNNEGEKETLDLGEDNDPFLSSREGSDDDDSVNVVVEENGKID